jgi:fructosamine-3-kinase
MPLSAAIIRSLETATGKIREFQPLTGGDINVLYRLRTKKGDFVVKIHKAAPPEFFTSEAAGLAALKSAGVAVPEIFLVEEDFLLMEYLPPGEPDPAKAGEQLAALHNTHATGFGFVQNTYLATVLQDNRPSRNAADFYFKRRLMPLIALLQRDSGREGDAWRKFAEKNSSLLNGCPRPSLLHGDLWAGNLHYAARGPVFIDPACYAADALIDIAMTRLFGGFNGAFYEAYWGNMVDRNQREDLIAIYEIYPLLVHAHLFAGGYYASACRIRDRFA